MTENADRGPWLPTHTGRRFYHQDPRPEDVHPVDVAHGLANLCRYNGQTEGFYSVAEHCLLLAEYARNNDHGSELQLELLIHDAAEAYVGDVILGLKDQLPTFRETEDGVQAVIREAFGLPLYPWPYLATVVHDYDRQILVDERDRLFPPGTEFHADLDGLPPLGVEIRCLEPSVMKGQYLTALTDLLSGKPKEFFLP